MKIHNQIVRNYLDIPGLHYHPMILDAQQQDYILEEISLLPWQTDLKRRVQHYGYQYDYKSRHIDPSMVVGPLPRFALTVAKQLMDAGLVVEMPDQMIVNEYEPGQGITPHVDCEPCFKDRIATISLGDVYTMDMIETATKRTVHVELKLGSCLIFSGAARHDWKHGIRARKTENGRQRGRRVSLTYRNVILEKI